MAFVAISHKKHADLRISSSNNLLGFAEKSSLPLYAVDVSGVACDYPIFFSQIEDTYRLNMMCSIDPKLRSVCITQEGEWVGFYAPAYLRQQPFAVLSNSEDDQQRVVCIDDESPMLGEEGEVLFDDGEPTEYLNKAVLLLKQLDEAGRVTSIAIRAIQEADLIVPWEINVPRSAGETITVTNTYKIDQVKFNALEDRKLTGLKKAGALTIIYGQLFSQYNLNKLVAAHNSMNASIQGSLDSEFDFLIDDEEISFNF